MISSIPPESVMPHNFIDNDPFIVNGSNQGDDVISMTDLVSIHSKDRAKKPRRLKGQRSPGRKGAGSPKQGGPAQTESPDSKFMKI